MKDATEEIQEDLKTTSWLQLFYRLEGVSMLILIPGTVILSGIFAYQSGIGLSEAQTIGFQYALGLIIIVSFIIAKMIVWTVNSVNDGRSIYGDLGDRVPLRLIISSLLISMPVYLLYTISPSLKTLVIISIISCVLLGSTIAGLCGIFSSAILLKSEYVDEMN
ncbi:hypothetical protein [Haloarcula amylovorans]|uniref:hypothetical protein n=1 Tax=Haloarcula amylovorans TaxID=2562280 RepID=UPI00143070A8|nr:hypothetical protein [Halomicroarcula amylolytica]